MKIKELKEIIRDLPDDMEFFILDKTQILGSENNTGIRVSKVKVKLVKEINGKVLVQSRPKKDLEAKLGLILE